jgi:predicted nucleic acid-binding protein
VTAYAESSAVLRWLFNEPGGSEVLGHLREARKVVCSRLTLIECRRAARRALTESRITEAELGDVLAALAQGAAHWAIVELTREIADRAAAAFPIEPVRTLDAIHLATMSAMRESLADLVMLTTDDRVRANGARLGFTVLPEVVPR